MAETRDRPLKASPTDVPKLPVADWTDDKAQQMPAVSSETAIHEKAEADKPKAGSKTRFLSQMVEDTIKSWPKDKNFTPREIHNKAVSDAIKGDIHLTSTSPSASQQKILEMENAGTITRISRGRYIVTPPAKPKPAAKKKTSKKAASAKKSAAKAAEPTPEPPKAKEVPEPVKEFDLDFDGASDLLIIAARSIDTREPEFWSLLGNLCRTVERMKDVLAGNDD